MIILRNKNFSLFDIFRKKKDNISTINTTPKSKKSYSGIQELKEKYRNLRELDEYERNKGKYELLTDEYLDKGGFINGDYCPFRFINDSDADWWNDSGIDENYRPVLEGTSLHDMLSVDRRTGKYYIYDPETRKATPFSNIKEYKKFILNSLREDAALEDSLTQKRINDVLNKY